MLAWNVGLWLRSLSHHLLLNFPWGRLVWGCRDGAGKDEGVIVGRGIMTSAFLPPGQIIHRELQVLAKRNAKLIACIGRLAKSDA